VSGRIQGKIVEITTQGDLITDLLAEQLQGVGRFGIFSLDHQQPPMTLVALLDPPGALRLHLVSDSAAMMLGVRVGADVVVSW
jgi:hypothetical protein